MIRHIGRWIALAAVSLQASSALAIFDTQLLIGRRWYDYKPEGVESVGVSSQEVQVAVHFDPIPLVPIALGAHVAVGSPQKNDFKVDQAALMQVSPELMFWLPMVPVITPYGKVRYPIQSALTTKQTLTDTVTGVSVEKASTYEVVGPHIAIGAKIPTLPLIKLLVEVGIGLDTYKSTEIKLAGAKADTKEKGSLNSKSVLIGLEVGL